MIKVGLTGSMGSGKTTVSKIFKTLDIPIFYADDEAKRLMGEDENLVNAITSLFGHNAYINGVLNRNYIAGIVFSDKEKLQKLNAIVHPVTIKAAETWMNAQTAPYAIKEAALLFEAGAAEKLQVIIGVHAPHDLRLQRIMQRDGATPEQFLNRERNQMEEEEKLQKCDFVILNDEKAMLLSQVLAIHEALLMRSAN